MHYQVNILLRYRLGTWPRCIFSVVDWYDMS
nr:MAG TPA: hypothetical protein [Caudoviricetes sp.]